VDKKTLSERDICTKFISPAIERAGWDMQNQLREEVYITNGRIMVRGRMTKRAAGKRVDYILFHKANIPIAIVEAKDNNHRIGDGMQQALEYAEMIDVPFVFSSNGDGFLVHDRTGQAEVVEQELGLDGFPSPRELWRRYCAYKGFTPEIEAVVAQDYYSDGGRRSARYYQINAVNRAVEAVAKGQDRLLLVMATGTGKTYTAFQIIWRLWKAGVKKRILFLADRNILIDRDPTASTVQPSTGSRSSQRRLPTAIAFSGDLGNARRRYRRIPDGDGPLSVRAFVESRRPSACRGASPQRRASRGLASASSLLFIANDPPSRTAPACSSVAQ
jgi:type I site-specific restriction endonuclease